MVRVSVNIPVYNGSDYIRDTLESVLAQTVKDFEIIIIDDGSNDGSGQVIKEFKDSRIKYFFQENKGIGAARNAAIEMSQGEYIAFLDQDDLWLPTKLEEELAMFDKGRDIGLVFCNTIFFSYKGDLFSYYGKEKPPQGMVFRQLLRKYFLSLETVMVRRSVLETVGLFPDYMMAEEYDLFLRIAYKFPFGYVDKALSKYRLHDKNYSWGRELEEIKEIRMTIDTLCHNIPEFENIYAKELLEKGEDLSFSEAIVHWRSNNLPEAKRIILRLAKTHPSPKIITTLLLIFLFKFKTYDRLSMLLKGRRKKNIFLWGAE